MPSETSSVMNGIFEFGGTIGDVFINLSAEYPALLDGILILFAAAGVLLGISAAFDVMKMGRKETHYTAPNAIFWKMIASASLVDLVFWGKVWTGTLWAVTDPMGISAYSAAGGDDYSRTAILAAIGFIVLAGYVTLGRAYFMASRLGYLSPEARSDLIGSIISRVAAGSMMIASMHIAEALDNSTGFNWLPV